VAADGDIIEIAHVDDVILAVINNVEITSDPIATGVDPAAGHRIFFSARDTAVLFNDVAFTTGGQPGAGAPLLSIQTTADAYTYDGDGARESVDTGAAGRSAFEQSDRNGELDRHRL
jgi:hypothetical protein